MIIKGFRSPEGSCIVCIVVGPSDTSSSVHEPQQRQGASGGGDGRDQAGTRPVLPASSEHLVPGLELICTSITSAESPEGAEGQIWGEIRTQSAVHLSLLVLSHPH